MSRGRGIEPGDEDLLTDVGAFIVEHRMTAPGEGVVVAVSGGPDSVVLLDLLLRLRERLQIFLHVAHLNHGLRGEQSERDAEFVFELAGRLNLPCHDGVADLKAASFKACSPEEAARTARHGFLRGVRAQTGCARIALGHTRSDQAETVLLRLLRGAGRRGLSAMRPVRDGVWIRPLLNISRKEVENYARLRRLDTRRDATNADRRFFRNWIRHDLLPRIEAGGSPSVERVLARTAEIFRHEDQLLDELAEEAFATALKYSSKQKIILDMGTIFGYHISLRRRLFQKAFRALGLRADAISFQVVQQLSEMQSQPSGSLQITPEIKASRHANWLILSRPTVQFEVRISVPGETEILALGATLATRLLPVETVRDRVERPDPLSAFFDASKRPQGLQLRNRKPGDRLRPYGMAGTRKLSDLLIDAGVPEPLRDEIPLLVGGNTIFWAIGIRRAQPLPVTKQTKKVLEVVFKGGWLQAAGPSPKVGTV